MPPEDLRRHGHQAVDWVAEYLSSIEDRPVLPSVSPGEIRACLPPHPPDDGEPFERIFADFRDLVVPGVTHWNHPGFLAWFANTGSGPGILGELLAAALNANAMVWLSSPAGTEVEELATDWLRQLLGLPEAFEGVINDTASSSSLYALAAARETALPERRQSGLPGGPPVRVYASTEAHSSIDKAVITLGMGREGLRRVEADGDFRLKPDALRAAIEDDRAAGVRPVAVVATLGTTSTSSVDPLEAVGAIAREQGLWLHVDAAYGGMAAIVPGMERWFRGWERADSIVVNPHKWLFTPMDCSVLYCSRPDALRAAFSLTPEYLRSRHDDGARNLMDYGLSLGRRFRALKLWFVLRYFGRRGIVDRLEEHCRLARGFAQHVDGAPSWERIAPVPFSTVVFRYAPEGVAPEEQDRLNRAILDRVNRAGSVFLSHTVLRGRTALRLAVGNLRTESRHVERAWEALEAAAREVAAAATA